MAKRNQNQHQNPEIIDAEFTTIETGGVLSPQPKMVNLRPRNTPRSNIQDGGYFDATEKRRPIFLILPNDDQMAALMAIRAWLSAFRHKPFQTVGVTGAALWFGFAGLSGGLNLLRGDVVQCSGDTWNPVVAGCNIAAAIAGPSQGLAGNLHDVVLGQDDVNEEIETRPKIRAVRVEE
jgi:hypothetical protein